MRRLLNCIVLQQNKHWIIRYQEFISPEMYKNMFIFILFASHKNIYFHSSLFPDTLPTIIFFFSFFVT